MADLISRQAAIEAVLKETNADGAYGYADSKSLVDILSVLPSVNPQKVGRWILADKDNIPKENVVFVTEDEKYGVGKIYIRDFFYEDNVVCAVTNDNNHYSHIKYWLILPQSMEEGE